MSQDNRTNEDRTDNIELAQKINSSMLSPKDMPLVYLNDPFKIIGDFAQGFNPNKNPFPTTQEDAYKIAMADKFGGQGDIQTREQLGWKGYAPGAALNVGMASLVTPKVTLPNILNESLNPLANQSSKKSTKTIIDEVALEKEIADDIPINRLLKDTELPIIEPNNNTLQLKSLMTENPKGLHKQVDKKGFINIENALKYIKNNEGQAKYELAREALPKNLPVKMQYNEFKNKISDKLITLNKEFNPKARSHYGLEEIGWHNKEIKSAKDEIKSINRSIYNHIEGLKQIKSNPLQVNPNELKKGIKKAEDAINSNKAYLEKIKKELIELEKNNVSIIENKTVIFSREDKFGLGERAHGNPTKTLGHAHYFIESADPSNFRISQIQSDWAQEKHYRKIMSQSKEQFAKGIKSMEKHLEGMKKYDKNTKLLKTPLGTLKYIGPDGMHISENIYKTGTKDYIKTIEIAKKQLENWDQLQLFYKNYEERLLQEMIVEAAGKKGINKVSLPTYETAAKIQKYRKTVVKEEFMNTPDDLEFRSLKQSVTNEEQALLYTKGEKLKEAKAHLEGTRKKIKDLEIKLEAKYSEESDRILRRYSKNPKLLKNLGIETKIVTDAKGNTWYEFEIPKSFKEGKGEIKALGLAPVAGVSIMNKENESPDKMQNGGWLDNFQEGGIIEDDRGQRAFPKEVTKISGDTMETDGYGDISLFVVPDKGKPRVVHANTGIHKFPGATKFTEYPLAENGIKLQELEQIPNFVSYSKPQPGGWLSKYPKL